MKVWEVIAQLSECKANADVYVQRGEGKYTVLSSCIDTEASEDVVYLIGDGSDSDDPDQPV